MHWYERERCCEGPVHCMAQTRWLAINSAAPAQGDADIQALTGTHKEHRPTTRLMIMLAAWSSRWNIKLVA